ncbi:hypothetical protein [Flavobacterium lindanitolerans]|uniref:hypothetical protein n=1 Tax=Flavobacterium lindanitolerans TaxID=428988 RepID=UPI0023F24104|nr:hypothetical protein [Flavobacterium lindanitolerans]
MKKIIFVSSIRNPFSYQAYFEPILPLEHFMAGRIFKQCAKGVLDHYLHLQNAVNSSRK